MSFTGRQIAIFLAGLALGLAVAWMVMNLRPSQAPAPTPAPAASNDRSGPSASSSVASAAAPAASASSGANAPRAACPSQTITAVAGPKDAQYQLQGDLSAKTEKDVPAFIVVGKEAAASGRTRDAEVAFMMACRVAEALKGAASLEAADAKYQLGWHYANLAQHSRAANRPELQKRAELMYADSLQTYRARHGEGHEKTRFASEGLASLRRAPPTSGTVADAKVQAPAPPSRAAPATASAAQGSTSEKAAPASAPAPSPSARAAPSAPASPGPARATQSLGAAPSGATPRMDPAPPPRSGAATGEAYSRRNEEPSAPPPQQPAAGAATAIRPSFDCAKARSQPEKLICADPELARMDRDLGGLYARARNAAPDAGAFRRQQDQAWREREANCRDRECLLRWYAQRRGQLNEALAQSRP